MKNNIIVIEKLPQTTKEKEKLKLYEKFFNTEIVIPIYHTPPEKSEKVSSEEKQCWEELLRRSLRNYEDRSCIISVGDIPLNYLTGRISSHNNRGLLLYCKDEIAELKTAFIVPDNCTSVDDLNKLSNMLSCDRKTITLEKSEYLKLINYDEAELSKQDVFLIYKNARMIFNQSSLYRESYELAVSPNKRGIRGGKLYICNCCNKVFLKKDTQLDHDDPVIEIGKSTADYTIHELISRLFCDKDNLKVLCRTCHAKKSADEAAMRAEARKVIKHEQ